MKIKKKIVWVIVEKQESEENEGHFRFLNKNCCERQLYSAPGPALASAPASAPGRDPAAAPASAPPPAPPFTETPWDQEAANYFHTYTLQLSENVLPPVKGRKKWRSDGPELNAAINFYKFF